MNKFFLLSLFVVMFVACSDSSDEEDCLMSAPRLVNVTHMEYIDPDKLCSEISSVSSLDNQVLKTIRPAFDPLFQRINSEQRKAMDKMFNAEVGGSSDGEKNWWIEKCTFTFRTKSASGEDIVLTGSVIYPNNTNRKISHELKSLTLSSKGAGSLTSTGDNDPADVLMEALRTFFNSAIIIPEYQGLRHDSGKHFYCFVSSKVLARQMADCVLAAMEVLESNGVTLAPDGYTLNEGSSQVGVIPLAFAKWYETEAPRKIREKLKMKYTVTYTGPIDFAGVMSYFSEHPDFDAMLCKGMVTSLGALSEEKWDGYQPEEFMANVFHTTKVNINGKDMTYYEAMGKYSYNVLGTKSDVPKTSKLSDILAADMLTANGRLNPQSPKTQVMLRLFKEENDVFDWQPTLPVYIMHCKEDNNIPYEVSYNYYDKLSVHGTNPNVHWGDIPLPAGSDLLVKQFPALSHVLSNVVITFRVITKEYPDEYLEKWEH